MQKLWTVIPRQMSQGVQTRKCTHCSQHVRKQDVIGIGIREISGTNTIFLEHCCSKCEFREITTFSGLNIGSPEEVCYMLLEELQNQKRLNKAKETRSIPQSKPMTNKEVNKFLSFLHKSNNHDDFMSHINVKKKKNNGRDRQNKD